MLLKSLEIQGFKTFPDKTKLTFDRGITSVVGPNGSGKSNISDAIRWVLGEQSTKALRCAKMEDVIFKGTDARKRTGYAEVTLTVKNDDRALPYNDDEVAVTRRFYRSGESEYLINKTAVRLKDIHELFMDTGLGRDGYSMISQGKIDSIVATKSEDRREIFEEAAGISRFRYRKSEAEKQLKLAEENLVRLRDILAELESRIGPLAKQSEKAQNFLIYSKEKRSLEISVWLDTLEKSAEIIREQSERISVSQHNYDELEKDLKEIIDREEKIYKLISDKNILADENRQSVYNLGEEISKYKSQISILQNDIKHNNETAIRLETEINVILDTFTDSKTSIEKKNNELQEKANQLNFKKSEYNKLIEQLNNYNENAINFSNTIQSLTSKSSEINKELSEAKMKFMSGKSTAEEIKVRISDIIKNKESQQLKLSDCDQVIKELNNLFDEFQFKKAKQQNTINEFKSKIEEKQAKSNLLRDEVNKIYLDANEALRKIKILEDLEKNMEGYIHSVKAVMKEVSKGKLTGIIGPVSRLLSVPTKFGTAIEIALGAAIQNIVTKSENDAKNAISFLKRNSLGRATFLPITNIKPSFFNEKGLEKYKGYIGTADNLCKYDDEYKNIISSLLGRIVIADDINSATEIAKAYGYKFKIVTLDGQVVNAGGSLTGGSTNKTAGLFTRNAEIENTKQHYSDLNNKLQEKKLLHRELEEEIKLLRIEISQKEINYINTKEDLIKIEAELKNKTLESENIKFALKAYDDEIKSCEIKISQYDILKSQSEVIIDKLSEELSVIDEQIFAITGDKDKLSKVKEEINSQLEEHRVQIAIYEREIESIKLDIDKLASSDKYQLERKENFEKELLKINEENIIKEKNIENFLTFVSEFENTIKQKSAVIERSISERTELEKESILLRQEEKSKQAKKDVLVRELAQLEERKQTLQKKYDDIISKLWEDYELTYREAQNEAVSIDNIVSANKKLNELKAKIKALGTVNVAAIEEYKEVSERYEFMSKQVKDVENSKKEILNLINKLTSQMSDLFLIRFNEISKNFSETFFELFGGGKAHLELTDPTDILNSGIEIYCHPPGKIVEHLEALSGGEKALVAISLYFAIMKVRPAPFCVMDEIEAALDDVNVYRFASYLRRMNSKTQFILITHRRGTMEEADVLYGVTMQDKGISNLLELKATEIAEKLKMEV